MKSITASNRYSDVLMELNYPFGNVYIFDGYIVSEISEGVVFTWEDHAKVICEDVANFVGSKHTNHIYISNRIHSYTVMATDWLKFFKNSYSLKGYYVVGNERRSFINTAIENLFFNSKIQRFNSIEAAINYAEQTQFIIQEI